MSNYPLIKRSAQEKVWILVICGLWLVSCGQSKTTKETQSVAPATLTAPTTPPTTKETHTTNAPKIERNKWQRLTPGIEFAAFDSPTPSILGEAVIYIARIDPTKAELVLVSASQGDKKTRTAKEWAQQEGLLVAINASMYQTDHLTSIHRMVSKGHTNNGKSLKENTVILLDPKTNSLPKAQIADASCQDLAQVSTQYETQIESIRMLSCEKKNVWKWQDKRWSHAIIGEDSKGNILFIHCRAPFVTHDFVNILLALPLDLVNLQYAEGGPESQLYIEAGDITQELFGSFETSFLPDDSNLFAWPVPNVIGVKGERSSFTNEEK
jgi:hypothetical protein